MLDKSNRVVDLITKLKMIASEALATLFPCTYKEIHNRCTTFY